MKDKTPPAMLTTEKAEEFWNGLSYAEKVRFAEFYPRLVNGELRFDSINVDNNERVKNITLVPKEQIGIPDKPFYKHFK